MTSGKTNFHTMTMKHIKLLGLLVTAAAVSFTTTSCSNSGAGDDVEFPARGEDGPIPADIMGDTLYIYEFPSKIADEEPGTLVLRFGKTRVTTEERTSFGTYSVSGTSDAGSNYTYNPISETEASIVVPSLSRPTKYDADKKEFSARTISTSFRLKYSEATGTYSVVVDGTEYTNVNYNQI